ncbi:hypothetical protein BT93_I0121 [Corymbia citriodora subsp. variegata]|nr:hypothetical protein BT93_I0121 [Corymbia citriodora subsp. variegata]
MEEVVIVGGGIAGLAMALALKKVGVRALVLERAKWLRATGAAIGLYPNAWLALEALGVSNELASLYAPSDKVYVTDVQTRSIQEVHFAPNDGSGGPLPRVVHRKVLLKVLAKELPPDSIRFSSNITSIETQEERGSPICIVTLDDGSTIKSKVVIGCDGVNSIVARWLGLSPPAYSGRSLALGLSVYPEGHGFEHGVRHQFVDVGKRAGFITLDDKDVYWFCEVMDPHKEKRVDPEMILREVSEHLTKDFPPVYHDILRHSDRSSLTWAPLVYRYPWDVLFGKLAQSNITVAGDAMHPMTPELGQGGCSSLEDAVVLARHFGDSISKHGGLVTQDIRFAIDKYIKERRLRATTLIAASFISGWLQTNGSGRLMKFLRDIVFYKLLFTFVFRMTRYDCGKLPSASFMPSRRSESST